MATKYEVQHKGVTVNIRKSVSTKGGAEYVGWEVRDYSGGKLVRHYRASLPEAKAKAREIAECLAGHKQEVLAWDEQQRISIRSAIMALDGVGVTIDRACGIVADALKLVPADSVVAACRAWSEEHKGHHLVPKAVKDAAQEFLSRRASHVSLRRWNADKSYLELVPKGSGRANTGFCRSAATLCAILSP